MKRWNIAVAIVAVLALATAREASAKTAASVPKTTCQQGSLSSGWAALDNGK
jgi:hypothetical protein